MRMRRDIRRAVVAVATGGFNVEALSRRAPMVLQDFSDTRVPRPSSWL